MLGTGMHDTMARHFKRTDAKYVSEDRASPENVYRIAFLNLGIFQNINPKGMRGYDFGAGYGDTVAVLRNAGAIMGACELSPVIAAGGQGIEVGGLECLERAGPQDFIICSMVFSLLNHDDRERFWSAARIKLSPGGLCFFLWGNARTSARASIHGLADPDTYRPEGFKLRKIHYSKILQPRWLRLLMRLSVPMQNRLLDERGISEEQLKNRADALLFVFERI